MHDFPLELHSTTELIEELLRRKTFLGVIVHSEQELKGQWKGERTFKVHYNSNLNAGQTCRLLDAVTQYLEQHGYNN
jgi:hypothetical protein